MDKSLEHNVGRKPDIKEYIPYDSIDIKYKSRQN